MAAASVAAIGRFAERDRRDRVEGLAAAMLDGDLDRALRFAGGSGARSSTAELDALAAVSERADAAMADAVNALARGDWDRAIGELGPVVRALPGDADARDLLAAARGRRIAGWEADERRAEGDGDHVAQERLLAQLAAADPGNPILEQRLRSARNGDAPLVLAHDRALWLVAPDGTDHRMVTGAVPASRPIWSPDRTRIAFVSSGPADGRAAGALHVVSPDGTGLGIIHRFAHPNAVPSWSPDGRSIAITSVVDWDLRREVGVLTVQVVDVANGRSIDISSQTGGHGTSPAWSPDGRYVAFIGRPVLDGAQGPPLSGPAQVWLWSAVDGTARSLTGSRTPGANRVVWSPAGDRLLVLTRAGGRPGESAGSAVAILGVDPVSGAIDEVAGRVEASASSWAPSWSPDGGWLAWVDGSDTIVLRDRRGGERRITVRRFLSGSITWSPGGESLIATAGDPAQPSVRIDGIGHGGPTLADIELAYDGAWPTGAPQWGPLWPAPTPGAPTIAGTGLDAEP